MSPGSVIVVGGGAVGLGCAVFLQADGWDVTLIDRAEPGQQTSFGNAGLLSVQSTAPVNTPQTRRRLPALLLRPTSPVRVRVRDLPATAPWLWAFARACGAAPAARSTAGQLALVREAGAAWRILLQRTGGAERVRWPGWLKLAEGPREVATLAAERGRLERAGFAHTWLDADGVAVLEPALGPRVAAGLWLRDDGLVDEPGALLREVAARFAAAGGRVVADEVRALHDTGAGVEVVGATATRRAEHAVLAAGPWSGELAACLGARVPLVAKRGYHLMLPQTAALLTRPLLSVRHDFVLAPMGAGLRLSWGAEIARPSSPPDDRPIRRLVREVRRLVPAAATAVAAAWSGGRPATPDSLPVIAPAPAAPRVVLAYGHGHLGLTLGPVTGRLVADHLAGRPPRIPLDAYAATR